MKKNTVTSSTTKASVLRQLAALFYDGLLLAAVLFAAFVPVSSVIGHGIIAKDNPILKIYLISICFLYFGWFWTRNGKTLGMRVWHIKLQRTDGQLLSWQQALVRFVSGLPAWGIILLATVMGYVPSELQQSILPTWLLVVPYKVLFVIGGCWLVVDHWPGSWRDKLTKTTIVVTE